MAELTGLSRFGPTTKMPTKSPTSTPCAADAKLVFRLTANCGAVESLAFAPNRHLLAVGTSDSTGRVWEIGGSAPIERAVFRLDASVRSVAFAANSRTFAAGSASGVVKLFDLSSGSLRDAGLLRGSRGSIDALAFSPDATLVAGGGADQMLRLWEPGKGLGTEPRTQLPGHTQAIRSLAFSPDGQHLVSGSCDASARIWALNRIRPGQLMSLPHTGEVCTATFSPDGRSLATSGKDQVIWLWDVTAAKPTVRTRLAGHPSGTRLVLITGDGETVVSVGAANDVLNWSPRSGRLRTEWVLPAGAATQYAVTTDGRYLARGLSDGAVEVYRVAEKRQK